MKCLPVIIGKGRHPYNYYAHTHTDRMLGRDELCASIKQCLEILTRAQECVEEISSPPSTFADLAALFEKFLCDLDEMDHKQAPPPTDDGLYKNKALSPLFNATLSLYNRLSHCTESIASSPGHYHGHSWGRGY